MSVMSEDIVVSNIEFVVAAYALAAVVLSALILQTVLRFKKVRKALDE